MRKVLAALVAAILVALLLWKVAPGGTTVGPGTAPPPAVPAARPSVPAPGSGTPPPAPAPDAAPAVPGAPPAAAEADLRIHGRVTDAAGAAMAGADVEVRGWTGQGLELQCVTLKTIAGAAGEYEVKVSRNSVAGGFEVETAVEGFLDGFVSVKTGEYDAERGVAVVMARGRAILGRVLDEYGSPLPRTVVQLWYGSETTWPTNVGADGKFRTPTRAPLRAFELIVEAHGFPERRVPVAASAGEDATDVGDIVFRRGGRIAGTVVDGAGRPVAGLPLELWGITGDRPSVRTDEAGRFEFADLGEGTVGVWVGALGPVETADGRSRDYSGGVADVVVGRTDVRVVVTAQTIVELRFKDATTGDPVRVTKSAVGVWLAGTAEPAPLILSSMTRDPPNDYDRFPVASGTRWDILLRSPGFEDARVTGVDVGDVAEMTVDVPLRRTR